MKSRILFGMCALLSAGACNPGPTSGQGNAALRYELACDSSDTRETSTLFCVRTDSSNGDVKRVDLSKVPATNGSTMVAEKGLGAFQVICDSTDTDSQAEFHCVRLDRITGEVVVVGLQKLAAFPN